MGSKALDALLGGRRRRSSRPTKVPKDLPKVEKIFVDFGDGLRNKRLDETVERVTTGKSIVGAPKMGQGVSHIIKKGERDDEERFAFGGASIILLSHRLESKLIAAQGRHDVLGIVFDLSQSQTMVGKGKVVKNDTIKEDMVLDGVKVGWKGERTFVKVKGAAIVLPRRNRRRSVLIRVALEQIHPLNELFVERGLVRRPMVQVLGKYELTCHLHGVHEPMHGLLRVFLFEEVDTFVVETYKIMHHRRIVSHRIEQTNNQTMRRKPNSSPKMRIWRVVSPRSIPFP
eukprot:scaffold15940_cov137-Amphora_coffeaeformis.AAC.2